MRDGLEIDKITDGGHVYEVMKIPSIYYCWFWGKVFLQYKGKIVDNGQGQVSYVVDSAFIHAAIPEGFKLPDSVTTIDDFAFNNIENDVSLPNGFSLANTWIISIGRKSFMCAKFPVGFTISSSVTQIGDYAFDYYTLLPNCFWFRNNSGNELMLINRLMVVMNTKSWNKRMSINWTYSFLLISVVFFIKYF